MACYGSNFTFYQSLSCVLLLPSSDHQNKIWRSIKMLSDKLLVTEFLLWWRNQKTDIRKSSVREQYLSVARSKLTFRNLFGLNVRSCTCYKQTQYGMLNRYFAVFIICSFWSPPHKLYSVQTSQITVPNTDLHVMYWINYLSQFMLQIINFFEKCDERQIPSCFEIQ